jgi:hypothetical protein
MLSPFANKNFVFDIQPLDNISSGTMPYKLTYKPIVSNLVISTAIGFAML